MALGCFDQAFSLADDSNVADVWYNVGQVAIGMPTYCLPTCLAGKLLLQVPQIADFLKQCCALLVTCATRLLFMLCLPFATHACCLTARCTMLTGIGDINMAHQAFSVASSMDGTHAEALINLGVLEVRQGKDSAALGHFQAAQKLAPHAYEAWYNGALVSMRAGNLQDCYTQAKSALEAFPGHTDAQDLLKQLQAQFNAL